MGGLFNQGETGDIPVKVIGLFLRDAMFNTSYSACGSSDCQHHMQYANKLRQGSHFVVIVGHSYQCFLSRDR